jgi:hypothetical protein
VQSKAEEVAAQRSAGGLPTDLQVSPDPCRYIKKLSMPEKRIALELRQGKE